MIDIIIYKVEGMSCSHCKNSVEKGLRELDGVKEVTAELSTGKVKVTGTVNDDDAKKVIEDLGYSFKGRIE